MSITPAVAVASEASGGGPPAGLVAATGALAIGSLVMAVAETSLWMHYLIDAGESISLVGLGFIMAAGVCLYRRRRLLPSLPLALPWLLFPVITRGDQISHTWQTCRRSIRARGGSGRDPGSGIRSQNAQFQR